MLLLKGLHLTNFKSYAEGTFEFSDRINAIVGENGSGKTNLLDAIYFLALTKSAFSSQDMQALRHAADFMRLEGEFHWAPLHPADAERHERLSLSLPRGQRKTVAREDKPYDRLTDHIGRIPVVLMAPNDTDLVREGPEERRKFFDGVLSQLNAGYLTDLLQYNRLLEQRNHLLRQFHERHRMDADLLAAYDAPLLELAQRLYTARLLFINEFLPVFQQQYALLSESREQVHIAYLSDLAGAPDFAAGFLQNRPRDLAAQRTTLGVHRDDFEFLFDGQPLKKFGSQGQQKSFVVALKLAQFQFIFQEKGLRPLLLLDDIFDKLDDRRITQLMARMADGTFGQVFLTDARPERTRQLLSTLPIEVRFHEITPPLAP